MSEVVHESSIYNSDGYRMYIQFFIFPLPMESKKPSSVNSGYHSDNTFAVRCIDRNIFCVIKAFDIDKRK